MLCGIFQWTRRSLQVWFRLHRSSYSSCIFQCESVPVILSKCQMQLSIRLYFIPEIRMWLEQIFPGDEQHADGYSVSCLSALLCFSIFLPVVTDSLLLEFWGGNCKNQIPERLNSDFSRCFYRFPAVKLRFSGIAFVFRCDELHVSRRDFPCFREV